jgi:hypothetical protein
MECSELLHSKVLKCFIKLNFGYDCLIEVFVNRTHWLDCKIIKWNLVGKCSDDGTIVQMRKMREHMETMKWINSRKTNYKINK